MKRILILCCLLVAATVYGVTTYTTNYQFGKPGDRDANYGETIRDNWDKADTQLKLNADSIDGHLTDTVDAHDATAISTTVGSFNCTTQTNVQAYLDCLDGVLDPGSSGIVLLSGVQTILGVKTFAAGVEPLFPGLANGVLSISGGALTTSTGLSLLTTKGDILTHNGTLSLRLPVGADDQVLVADSGEASGVKWGDRNPKWRKFTFSYTDFSAASTTFSVTATSLVAGEGIEAVIIKHNTPFTGGSLSGYSLRVGVSGDVDKYSPLWDVFQAASGTVSLTSRVLDVPNFSSSTDLIIFAEATGGNTSEATAGSVDIYIKTFDLP